MQDVLITGASRGIGLELSRQYLQRGACSAIEVIETLTVEHNGLCMMPDGTTI